MGSNLVKMRNRNRTEQIHSQHFTQCLQYNTPRQVLQTQRNDVNTFNCTTPLPWCGIPSAVVGVSLSSVADAGIKCSGQINVVTGTPIIDSRRAPWEMTRLVEVRLQSQLRFLIMKLLWAGLLFIFFALEEQLLTTVCSRFGVSFKKKNKIPQPWSWEAFLQLLFPIAHC